MGTSEGGDAALLAARDARGEGTHTSASFACASIIERLFRWFLRRREGREGGARVRRGEGGRGRGNEAAGRRGNAGTTTTRGTHSAMTMYCIALLSVAFDATSVPGAEDAAAGAAASFFAAFFFFGGMTPSLRADATAQWRARSVVATTPSVTRGERGVSIEAAPEEKGDR